MIRKTRFDFRRWSCRGRGFALPVVVSLMVLLAVLAVGLLALSAVTLRSSGQGESMAVARANARLALTIALGELQKAAGPDQRITAPATLVDAAGSPAVTGVWQAWVPDGEDTDYTMRKRQGADAGDDPLATEGRFVTWLASGNAPAAGVEPTAPPGTAADGDLAILVADHEGPEGPVRGVRLGKTRVDGDGTMAWTVIDEGVKARIDLPLAGHPTDEARESLLRAPARPQPEAVAAGLEGLRMGAAEAAKITSLPQAAVHLGGPEVLRDHFHDLTPHAASLFTNVADGGLKADLTRAFEGRLPEELEGRHLYSHDDRPLVPADPVFNALADHYRLYRQSSENLQLRVPNRYRPTRGNRLDLDPPEGGIVAPVITRVSVVFSLVSRTAHGGWLSVIPSAMQNSAMRQMVYLIYTPVVTVYNPYSAPLEVQKLKVNFRNLPVAFKFFRNGEPLQDRHALLSTFHISSQDHENWDDPFGLTAAAQPGSSSSTVVLGPGEARVFGVSHPAGTTWDQMNNYLWQNDLHATKTQDVFSGSGWDYRSGFIVDWLIPNVSGPTHAGRRRDNNQTMGVFGATASDRVNVEVTPRMPGRAEGRFDVEIAAVVRNRPTPLGVYRYIYRDERTLERVLRAASGEAGEAVGYPFRMERDLTVGPNRANSIFLPGGLDTPLRQWGSAPRPFAIFSLTARTANDSLYPGKPGVTSSFVHNVLEMDVGANHPALLPMEMQLLPISGAGANVAGSIEADEMDRAFYFSGLSRGTGAIAHVARDVPRHPLVNLADLRHADIAGGGYLPLPPMSLGESLASAYVSPGRVIEPTTGFGYPVPDHAWHANRFLWDRYFFSGIRHEEDAAGLFAGRGLPLRPRIEPAPSAGLPAPQRVARALDEEAWSRVAGSLWMRGGFNVNSTSVAAWKAVLSSLRKTEVPVLGPVEINAPQDPARQVVMPVEGTPMPRQTRPIAGPVDAGNADDNTRRWSGFRELDDEEIDRLAREIVGEVRARGPFLSMAEFVNRRIGEGAMAEAGALESAIRKAAINDPILPVGGLRISEAQAAEFGYAHPAAAAGSVEEGAAGVLRQGDLLSAIGAHVTVRSDTFVIRGYGEARAGGRVTARAWCEAVVQRVPGFVDPSDPPDRVRVAAGQGIETLGPANRRFGRRFEILSFKWLRSGEI